MTIRNPIVFGLIGTIFLVLTSCCSHKQQAPMTPTIIVPHHTEIVEVCSRVARGAQMALNDDDWPSSTLELRCITYSFEGAERLITVDFCGTQKHEVVWHGLRFCIQDGMLVQRPPRWRTISKFADAMIFQLNEAVKKATAETNCVAMYSWPVANRPHKWVRKQGDCLLALYRSAVRENLNNAEQVMVEVSEIRYETWFREKHSNIFISFEGNFRGKKGLQFEIKLTFENGQFLFCQRVLPGCGSEEKNIVDQIEAALDIAIHEWLKRVASDPNFGGSQKVDDWDSEPN